MSKTNMLRSAVAQSDIVSAIGVYDGISALVAEKQGFQALWASGLSISAAHGMPDASILTMTEFLAAASIVNRATSLPVIADCDTGFGMINNVIRMVKEYEHEGIAAVCIEDKEFPKRNSLLDGHKLADVAEFSAKIRAAKYAQSDPDFMVIARVEAFIAGLDVSEALLRANAYCEAGADAIVVHSKAKTPSEIWVFAAAWRSQGQIKPLIVIPTTYYTVTREELKSSGIKMVIYANQALRAAIWAMNNTLTTIRDAGSSAPAEATLVPLVELYTLIGTNQADINEARFTNTETLGKDLREGKPYTTSRLIQPDRRQLIEAARKVHNE